MKSKSKKLFFSLKFMTVAYAFSFACYGYIMTSNPTPSPSLYFWTGLTCLLMVAAWLATLIEYKIERLKEELLSTTGNREAKNRTEQVGAGQPM